MSIVVTEEIERSTRRLVFHSQPDDSAAIGRVGGRESNEKEMRKETRRPFNFDRS